MMLRILLALWLFWSAAVQAQLVTLPIPGAPGLSITVATGTAAQALNMISSSPNAVNVTMTDDANVPVPLQFAFPFFGQNFTQSWMHSNGVVSFQNPQITGNFCCVGQNLATTTNPALNYAIMPLWTDLIATTVGSHWYLSRPTDMTYAWYNVNQYGTQNASSFEVKIDRQGLVDVRLQGALITASPVTLGMTGDLAQAQYFQYYHGAGFTTQSLQWSALSGTTAVDPCVANPLSSPTCPNYVSAWLNQQCTVTALYDPACPGYAQAYFDQQCSINPLYNSQCPGYAQAYALQQLQASNTASNTSTATTEPVATAAESTENQTTSAAPSASPANVTTAVPLVTTGNMAGPMAVTNLVPTAPAAPAPETKSQPQTRAQQLAQARQQAQRRAMAAQGATSQERARSARSLEEQQAAQDSVVTAMGHNAAFDTYRDLVLRDRGFYPSVEIYSNNRTVDNARALRGLTGASDQRHQQIVEGQYR